MRKTIVQVILAVLLAVGAYFLVTTALTGLFLVQADKAKRNSTTGSLAVVDVFEDFNAFDITVTDPIFQSSGGKFEIAREYRTVYDFDGTLNKYNLLFNDQPADKTISSGPQLNATYNLAFWDLEGKPVTSMSINIRFVFSATRIYLTLSTEINTTQLGFLNQYLQVNGLKLRLIDEQFNSKPIETDGSVFVFFRNDSETLKVVNAPANTSLSDFQIETPEGHYPLFFVNNEPIDINTFIFVQNTAVDIVFERINLIIGFDVGFGVTHWENVPYGTTPDVSYLVDYAMSYVVGFNFVGWDNPFPITSSSAKVFRAVYELADGFRGGIYEIDVPTDLGFRNYYTVNLGAGDWSLNGKVFGELFYDSGEQLRTKNFFPVQIPFVFSSDLNITTNTYYGPELTFKIFPSDLRLTSLKFYYAEPI